MSELRGVRLHERSSAPDQLRVWAIDVSSQTVRAFTCNSVDVSDGGVGLRLAERLESGDLVAVSRAREDGSVVFGEVRHVRELAGGWRQAGVRFVEPPEGLTDAAWFRRSLAA